MHFCSRSKGVNHYNTRIKFSKFITKAHPNRNQKVELFYNRYDFRLNCTSYITLKKLA